MTEEEVLKATSLINERRAISQMRSDDVDRYFIKISTPYVEGYIPSHKLALKFEKCIEERMKEINEELIQMGIEVKEQK